MVATYIYPAYPFIPYTPCLVLASSNISIITPIISPSFKKEDDKKTLKF